MVIRIVFLIIAVLIVALAIQSCRISSVKEELSASYAENTRLTGENALLRGSIEYQELNIQGLTAQLADNDKICRRQLQDRETIKGIITQAATVLPAGESPAGRPIVRRQDAAAGSAARTRRNIGKDASLSPTPLPQAGRGGQTNTAQDAQFINEDIIAYEVSAKVVDFINRIFGY